MSPASSSRVPAEAFLFPARMRAALARAVVPIVSFPSSRGSFTLSGSRVVPRGDLPRCSGNFQQAARHCSWLG